MYICYLPAATHQQASNRFTGTVHLPQAHRIVRCPAGQERPVGRQLCLDVVGRVVHVSSVGADGTECARRVGIHGDAVLHRANLERGRGGREVGGRFKGERGVHKLKKKKKMEV